MIPYRQNNRGTVAQRTVLLLLCAFALVLILVKPAQVPPLWFDEGWNLSVARNLVDSGMYAQLSLGEPVPPTLLSTGLPGIAPIALSFELFGVGAWQGRLPGQLFTALALLLLCLLASKLFNPKVATAALFIALLMTGAHAHLHPVVLGRQALGEMPAISFLLMGYLCMLAGWRKRPWLIVPGAVFWSLGLSTKPQTLPFFAISLAVPMALAAARREWRWTGLLASALIGSLLGFVAWDQLPNLLFPQVALPHSRLSDLLAGIIERRANTMLDMTFVTTLAPHLNALKASWIVVLPALAGIVYAIWVTARRWLSARNWTSDTQITGLAVLCLTTSWFAWWALLSIGWLRYLFPALFISCIFTAALLHDLTGGFSLSFTVALFTDRAKSRRRSIRGLALLVTIAFICIATFTSLRTLGNAYIRDVDGSLEQIIAFLNEEAPREAVVETFESELLFLLDRPYHYPSNEIQLQLNRRTFLGQDVSIEYDPLQAQPQYLVIGPMAKLWKLYDPAVNTGLFRPLRQFGMYDLYERAPAAAGIPELTVPARLSATSWGRIRDSFILQ